MRIIPYVPNHFLLLDLDDHFSFLHEINKNPIYRYANDCDIGHTFVDKGKVIACYGATEVRDGVCFAWCHLSKDIRLSNLKMVIATFRSTLNSLNACYSRIETVTLCGYDKLDRFVTALGFSLESEMCRKWDGKRDYKLWARIK